MENFNRGRMKVAIYLSGVPSNKNELKIAALKRFGTGVEHNGDTVEYVTDHKIVEADVSVIQGYVHNDVSSPHLKLRKQVLDKSSKTIIIDSNLFQFADPARPNFYLRYSLNGIFPNTGFYFNNSVDNRRWASIQRELKLNLTDYRQDGKHILICLQRIDGWSMTGNDVQKWLNNTIRILKDYTKRPILVRRHPGDKQQTKIIFPVGVKVSKSTNIREDLENAWATVTFNSSPGVASLISGVPVFVTDPIPQHSQTWPLCNTNLSKIETPEMPDRMEWINSLSQSHWNEYEVESGQAWAFMKERLMLLEPNLC